MIIYANYFDNGSGDFTRLTKAFENSIKKNTDHSLIIRKLDWEKAPYGRQSHFNNLRKLYDWNTFFQNEASEEVILMDTDTIVLSPLDDFKYNHFAITTREDHDVKYNAGVVFLKHTERARQFMNDWYQASANLFEHMDVSLLSKYKGLTQSALSIVHSTKYSDIKEIPCDIYNLAKTDWDNFSDKTKVIHIKDDLREVCLHSNEHPKYNNLVNIWRRYDY